MNEINMLDFAVLGLLLVSAFIGIARGFTREVLGIGAWIGALFIALYGLVIIRPLLAPYIKSPFVADVVAGLLLFVIGLFILGSFSRAISSSVKGSVLGGLDRSLGFVFGIARGGVVLVIGYFAATLFSKPETWPDEIKAAKSYPYVLEGAEWLKTTIPMDSLKNLGLDKKEKEEIVETAKVKSVEHVVSALSQPKAIGAIKTTQEEANNPKKDEGYADTQRSDMERLVKNNE